MKKFGAFLITCLVSVFLITEIRTPRSMECFGCHNVKCVVREVDEHPQILITNPEEVILEFQRVPDRWD